MQGFLPASVIFFISVSNPLHRELAAQSQTRNSSSEASRDSGQGHFSLKKSVSALCATQKTQCRHMHD